MYEVEINSIRDDKGTKKKEKKKENKNTIFYALCVTENINFRLGI